MSASKCHTLYFKNFSRLGFWPKASWEPVTKDNAVCAELEDSSYSHLVVSTCGVYGLSNQRKTLTKIASFVDQVELGGVGGRHHLSERLIRLTKNEKPLLFYPIVKGQPDRESRAVLRLGADSFGQPSRPKKTSTPPAPPVTSPSPSSSSNRRIFLIGAIALVAILSLVAYQTVFRPN